MTAVPLAAHPPVGLRTILGLSMGAVVALGFARFSYALLLPPMRADLGWSYAQAGALNTANAAGYVVGALATAAISARFGARRTFLTGLIVTALALLGAGATGDFMVLLALRGLAGFTGALSFVVGAVLAAEAGIGAPPRRQAWFIAVYFGGGGSGMVASSLAVPLVLALGGGWRAGWLVLGALSCLCVPLAVRAVRAIEASPQSPPAAAGAVRPVRLLPTFTAYVLFGAGYIAYMTFIIAFLRGEAADDATIAGFWCVLGLSSLAGGFLWGRLFAGLPGGWPMTTVLVLNAIGAALPLLAGTLAMALLSAVLFGATVMAVPSAATAFVRKSQPEAAWTAALGRLTVIFGLGQCLGPLLSGALSDTSSAGIRTGLSVSAGILLAGALAAAFQAEPRAHPRAPRLSGRTAPG
jgi:predicted MFS family arabinose efflux permease